MLTLVQHSTIQESARGNSGASRELVLDIKQQTHAASLSPSLADFVELAKPRMAALLVAVAALSYGIAAPMGNFWPGFLLTLLCVSLLSFGIFPLNQYMEREQDSQMYRTRRRPIPAGRISSNQALAFSLIMLAASFISVGLLFHHLVLLLFVLIAALYLLVYTPLKYKTVWHTTLGAIPGAAPPLVGWAIARGELDLYAWILFAILFFWQYPHFLAIELMYQDDYARVNTKVASTVASRKAVDVQIIGSLVLLIGTSILPWALGYAGIVSGLISILAGLFYLGSGIHCVRQQDKASARTLLKTSVLYLPCVFTALLLPF